jgi:hypothetical protein
VLAIQQAAAQIRLVPPDDATGWHTLYFDQSFRQLTTAITIPISAVIGPVMDQVVVLLIWLPPSTPNPWSPQIRPNSTRINPTVNVATKVLLIQGSYARFGQLLSKTWTTERLTQTSAAVVIFFRLWVMSMAASFFIVGSRS